MTTEPVIIPPANFSDADVVDWMKEKLSSIKVLGELNARREELVDKLEKLDAEIDKYKIKSAIQIQSK
ncbi:TPA: hypothetical protein SMV28_003220 [Proteus mirabilis]|uniref:hypothetical protein n=1 Tax=Proteus mirabilis TaxID=584 RepID=UPI00107378AF|nr:hypothetical protein [Proteus mirabilis]MBF0802177.1 hypothetical protein [Proteus mirabilis]MBG2743417.1 hypothetical protein [Proteus mirabilis]MBG6017831.1 hypothetical protein [Proteus mirabilis]MBS3856567.1 hypothetical protein [Proteus mirabilis]MDC9747345.1 hypothetical protein [Proteus mirabilis]